MQRQHFLTTAVVLSLVVFGIGALVYLKNKPQFATSYEDADGWVYSCSRPIQVKSQGATYASGKPSQTPVHAAEALAYCHKIGIE